MTSPGLQKKSNLDHLADVEKACKWLGLSHGRTHQYIKLLNEFNQGQHNREHILCINECYEIVDIHQKWNKKIKEFPGLAQKIKTAFLKGPILQEDEVTNSSSNEARNNAFTYFISGTLLSRGLNVTLVDGVPKIGNEKYNDDIRLDFNGENLIIECKRPQTQSATLKRVKKGIKQIGNDKGIIAVDCSVFIRPAGTLFESNSEIESMEIIGNKLDTYYTTELNKLIQNNLIALIFFARVPTMTRISQSQIIDIQGKPLATNYRPGSVVNLIVCSPRSLGSDPFVQEIYESLKLDS